MTKTKAEQAEEYAEDLMLRMLSGPISGHVATARDGLRMAYLAGWEAAEQSMWRSVEEELPEENVYVLVRCSDVYYPEICCCLACFLHGGWVFFDDFYRGCTVSHWMPIPPLLTTKNQEKQI